MFTLFDCKCFGGTEFLEVFYVCFGESPVQLGKFSSIIPSLYSFYYYYCPVLLPPLVPPYCAGGDFWGTTGTTVLVGGTDWGPVSTPNECGAVIF